MEYRVIDIIMVHIVDTTCGPSGFLLRKQQYKNNASFVCNDLDPHIP